VRCGISAAVSHRRTITLPVFTAYTSWHPGTSCDGRRRKSIPRASHSAQETFPSQSSSRHASGTSPSRASCTARNAVRRKNRTGAPTMSSARARGFNGSVLDPVVRRFLRHLHVVDVALAQASGGDAYELRLRPQLVRCRGRPV